MIDPEQLAIARRSVERFAREVVEVRAGEIGDDPRAAMEVLNQAAALGIAAFGDAGEGGIFAWNDGEPDVVLGVGLLEALSASNAGVAFLLLVQGLASCAAGLLGRGPLLAPASVVVRGGALCWAGSVAMHTFRVDGSGGGARLAVGPVPCGPVGVLGLREAHPHAVAARWREDHALDGEAGLAAAARISRLAAIGGTAIAAGLARGALDDARRYARERFQGGALIADLPVVRGMLERAADHAHAASARVAASLAAWKAGPPADDASSAFAAAADGCVEAVTTALQVLGGYGYMAEFGLERRFRDAHALRLAIGGRWPRGVAERAP